ncbi:hypothetical protein ASPVEDRAFT_432184 [Aspergillus versicolor CBS 583.65]|uniref:Copper transporter n=1 Tax=Aspergillus versicolor CBS 583.65 TaxID=1036611 RepID=A0A1L9P8L6_ASPVE|nr:uncharacterized protein ASPVEDRAFT_432184 [Aspergillus versicolor CBS 583.65]OJI97836.1 hypothetical protein ASPVEDRAFT_432184 [Aspergillus versicolor CBS 583.65]
MSFVTLLSCFIIHSCHCTRDRNATFIWPMLRNRRGTSIIGCGGGSEVDSMLISGTGLALLLYVFLLEDLRACEAAAKSLAANSRGEGCSGSCHGRRRLVSRHRCIHEIAAAAAAGLGDRGVWRCNTA